MKLKLSSAIRKTVIKITSREIHVIHNKPFKWCYTPMVLYENWIDANRCADRFHQLYIYEQFDYSLRKPVSCFAFPRVHGLICAMHGSIQMVRPKTYLMIRWWLDVKNCWWWGKIIHQQTVRLFSLIKCK